MLCFPWFVVELKKKQRQPKFGEVDDELGLFRKVNCQAANGASSALGILEKLAKFTQELEDNEHIPPVVTMTCVGTRVKVWLAYSKSKDGVRDHVSYATSLSSLLHTLPATGN